MPETADKWKLYTYEDMRADIAALAEAWPELVSPGVLGMSVEGREIPFFLLGRGKREVLLCASMHAREYVCTNVIMYMAERYCRCYAAGESLGELDVRALLDQVRLVIVPMVNPDGVTLAQLGDAYAEGKPAAEMPLTDAAENGIFCWKANIRGVDLNANWPLRWGLRRVEGPSSADYPGSAPLSEPESQAMLTLLEGGDWCSLCSFHTAGECIYWIDEGNPAWMREQFLPLLRRISEATGYELLAPEARSASRGCMVNYARDRFQRPCMTVELCPSRREYPFADYEELLRTAERVLPIGLLLAEDALSRPEPEDTVDLLLDGRRLAFAGPRPRLTEGSVLAPLDALCAACGLEYTEDPGSPSVRVVRGSRRAVLTDGSATMYTDRGETPLPSPARWDGRALYVPVRELLEYFGFQVDWDRDAGVRITSPEG